MAGVPRGTLLIILLVALVLIGILVSAKVLSSSSEKGSITITLNQEKVKIPQGTSAAALLNSLEVTLTRGNLLDIKGGLLEIGGGELGSCEREGQILEESEIIKSGDVIEVKRGKDAVEDTWTSRKVSKRSPLKITVKGPVYLVKKLGKNAEKVTNKGTISGLTAESSSSNKKARATIAEGIRYVDSSRKIIALTFDDGPNKKITPQILDILKEEGAVATFFVVTGNAEKHPNLIRRIVDEGSQVAMHSRKHKKFSTMSPDGIRKEIIDGQNTIEEICGVRPDWIRPPYGAIDGTSLSRLKELDVHIAMWDIDTNDWRREGVKKITRAAKKGRAGSVVLMHDGGPDRSQTVKALPKIIQSYKKRGFEFVTMDEYGELLELY